jgi:hypothetical protein
MKTTAVIIRREMGLLSVMDSEHMVPCPCLKGRSVHLGRARHFFRQADGTMRPACIMCADNSQLHSATKFDEDTVNEYVCREIMET